MQREQLTQYPVGGIQGQTRPLLAYAGQQSKYFCAVQSLGLTLMIVAGLSCIMGIMAIALGTWYYAVGAPMWAGFAVSIHIVLSNLT